LERLEDRVVPSLTSVFELDGNAITGNLTSGNTPAQPNTSTTTSHDWDQVFADAGSPTKVPGQGDFTGANNTNSQAVAGSFVNDPVTSNSDDIFTGGGSKDTNGIQSGAWQFTAGRPQPKDDIANAFAAAYVDPSNGHLYLYAGADRYSNNGDSTMGFWFFDNQIGEGQISNKFTGTHSTGFFDSNGEFHGDILVISNFTQGGSVSTPTIYGWVGDDATGHLQLLGSPSGNTIAVVNNTTTNLPWSFQDKSGTPNNGALPGEFIEEGVDLTALGIAGCFNSFLAETRSSQSPTATLSDFALGKIDVCSLAASSQGGLSKATDSFTYPLTVKNTGAIPLYITNVTDSPAPTGQVSVLGTIVANQVLQQPGAAGVDPSVTAISSSFDFTKPLQPGQSLTIFVTRTVQATDPFAIRNTITFTGTDDPASTETPDTASVTDEVDRFVPSATLSLTASPTAATVGTPISYTYTMTDTSSFNSTGVVDATHPATSPDLVLNPNDPNSKFTDTLLGDLKAQAIAAYDTQFNLPAGTALDLSSNPNAPNHSFTFTVSRTLKSTDPTPLTNSAEVDFQLAQNLGNFTNIIKAPSQVATVHVVDANISIAPKATNEVGQEHTFTVTVDQVVDGVSSAAANANVTVTLTNTNGAVATQFDSVPLVLSGTTNSSGHFQVSFTSLTAGEVIGNATANLTVDGVALTRATGDSHTGDSGPAAKTFEDAQISIGPNATNGITEPHTVTVTVLENAGDGKGFVAAANDPVTVTLTGQNGAVPIAETPPSGTTNASGQFLVTFTSDSPGQVIANASTTFTLNGVTLTRATGDSHTGDSGPATKTFVAGKILWKKVDESANLLGGATFRVTATGGTAAGLSPTSVTVTDNGSFDADPTNGLFELDAFQTFGGSNLTGLALGTYTIQEITPPPGYTLDPKVLTVTLTQSSLTGDLTGTPFVDTLPKLSIVKTVTANQTVIHPGDTASFTITVSNTGAGTANNVVMTDNLPDASQLTWGVTSFTGFDSASISSSGVLTASEASMVGGKTASVVVSAKVPLDFFGTSGGGTGTGNGDPVPLNLFELDGNVTTGVLGTSGSTTTSHDWDQVFADNTANPKTNTAGAIASSFVNDPINTTNDDIFTGGGSKDPNPISQWQFKNGKPQGKDDIENAFAALYKDPTTDDQILYAGLTRYDNSGDSTAGFWFFVNPVSEKADGTFSGTHSNGDILLVSDFTIGGSVSTINVFEWLNGNLVLVNTGNLANGTTFAIVNGGPISVPASWNFVSKSGGTSPDHGEFLEEGINLTGLGLNGCFSSFLAETRSSQSVTATLSDLVLGNFSTCDVMLPNQASVQASNFNKGQPITSNQVVIDLNDGHSSPAAPTGSRAPMTSLSLSPQVSNNGGAGGSTNSAPANLSSVPPGSSGVALSLGASSLSNGSDPDTWESALQGALEAERKRLVSMLAALDQLFIDWVNQELHDPLGIGRASIMGT
jgi:uncharacterized repeat protein (TIGR01451 family)